MISPKEYFEVDFHYFPIGIVRAISERADNLWELVSTTKNPNHNQDYDIMYDGETVMSIGRMYGFGFGSNTNSKLIEKKHISPLRDLTKTIDRVNKVN